jgi:hypothetical protein
LKTAASERLADLSKTAAQLRAILDAEGKAILPGLLVARVAVAADAAAAKLQRSLEDLRAAQDTPGVVWKPIA